MSDILKENTNLRVLLVGGGFVVVSFVVMTVSENCNDDVVRAIGIEVGAAILIASLASIAWEVFLKRGFAREILRIAEISENIRKSGIESYSSDFENNFRAFIEEAEELQVFVAYARTWRNQNIDALRNFLSKGRKLTVILPDPEDSETMNELARRFGTNVEDQKRNIEEALDFFKGLFQHCKKGDEIKIYTYPDRYPIK